MNGEMWVGKKRKKNGKRVKKGEKGEKGSEVKYKTGKYAKRSGKKVI